MRTASDVLRSSIFDLRSSTSYFPCTALPSGSAAHWLRLGAGSCHGPLASPRRGPLPGGDRQWGAAVVSADRTLPAHRRLGLAVHDVPGLGDRGPLRGEETPRTANPRGKVRVSGRHGANTSAASTPGTTTGTTGTCQHHRSFIVYDTGTTAASGTGQHHRHHRSCGARPIVYDTGTMGPAGTCQHHRHHRSCGARPISDTGVT